jgi:hypothetical protein
MKNNHSSVARWRFSPPDLQNSGGFESRLVGKKYFWRTGGLPISGGFLADLTNFVWLVFCLADLADSGGFGAFISKKQLASHFFCITFFVDLKK